MVSIHNKNYNRIPVLYKNTPLMPMRWKRARIFIKQGKAKLKYNKIGILYLYLLIKPSGFNLQKISIGIDVGSKFDGISIVSKYHHLLNLELIHTTGIKDRMRKRREFRRIRRSRLWHRKMRNQNRTSSKLPPTVSSRINFKKYVLSEIIKLFPISVIYIEDVCFNHYNKRYGKYFSLCEIGKNELYSYIKNELNIRLFKIKGYITKRVREIIFSKDKKIKQKDKKSFYSHCIDSYSLACLGFKIRETKDCCLETIFINRNWICRRELRRLRKVRKDSKDKVFYYFRYKKGGIVERFPHIPKPRKVRIKPDTQKSNHGNWEYKLVTSEESFKCEWQEYGGTISKGNSRSKVETGVSKKRITCEKGNCWRNNEYERFYE